LIQVVYVERDSLKMRHVVESEATAKATVAALGSAPATKGFVSFPVISGVIDDHIAAAETISKIEGLVDVLSKNGHLQAVAGGVGKLDSFLITVDRNNGNDRAEGFFIVEQHFGRDIVDDRGFEKEIGVLIRQPFASDNDARAFLLSVGEMPLGFFENREIVHRAHMHILVERIANADGSCFLNDEVKKILMDAAINEDALRGAADLPGVEVGAKSSGLCGTFEVGVFENDLRAVATKLH